MIGMGKQQGRKSRRVRWATRTTIPTEIEAKDALTAVREKLRRPGTLLFRGTRVTQEAIFGALCLWADAQPAAALEAALRPFVARLEEIVEAHENVPESPGGEVEDATITTVNNPPARKEKGGKARSHLDAYRSGKAV